MNLSERIKKAAIFENYEHNEIQTHLKERCARLWLSQVTEAKKELFSELKEIFNDCVAKGTGMAANNQNPISLKIDWHVFLMEMYLIGLKDQENAKKHCFVSVELLDNCEKITRYPQDIYLTAAYFHKLDKNYERALQCANKSAQYSKRPFHSYLLKIDIYYELKNYKAVLETGNELDKALAKTNCYQLHPRNELIFYMQRADAYLHTGDFYNSKKCYQKLARGFPANESFAVISALCASLQQGRGSLPELEAQLKRNEKEIFATKNEFAKHIERCNTIPYKAGSTVHSLIEFFNAIKTKPALAR